MGAAKRQGREKFTKIEQIVATQGKSKFYFLALSEIFFPNIFVPWLVEFTCTEA